MTTAKTTEFVFTSIEVAGRPFHFDGNQKITSGNGTFEQPAPNAFSMTQVATCPLSTPICRETCYVHNLEKFQPDHHALYRENEHNMRAVISDGLPYTGILARAFAQWILQNSRGGFRWHVSGDVFSTDYARFIRRVAKESPLVPHWIYTRSFPFLHFLVGVSNLTVNVSADRDNYPEARAVARNYGLRVCYLTVDGEVPDDLEEGDVIFPDYALRGVGQRPFEYRRDSEWWESLDGGKKKMVCPVDVYGKSEHARCGPCKKCLL